MYRLEIPENELRILKNKKYCFVEDIMGYIAPHVELNRYGYLIDSATKGMITDSTETGLQVRLAIDKATGEELYNPEVDVINNNWYISRIIQTDLIRSFVEVLNSNSNSMKCKMPYSYCVSGFIEKEQNLSQDGKCMVEFSSMIFGNASVSGDASIYNGSKIYGNAVVKSFVGEMSEIAGDIIVEEGCNVAGCMYCYTIPQLIRESSRTGNHSFIVGNNVSFKRYQLLGIDGHIYGNIESLHERFLERNDYGLKHMMLSNVFNFKLKESTKDKVIRCLTNAGRHPDNRVISLVFDEKNYAKYDILDEYIVFFNKFEQDCAAGLVIGDDEQLLRYFDSYVEANEHDNIETALFNRLRKEFISLDFMKNYRTFCNDLRFVRDNNLLIESDETKICFGSDVFADTKILYPKSVIINNNVVLSGKTKILSPMNIEGSLINSTVYRSNNLKRGMNFKVYNGHSKADIYRNLAYLTNEDGKKYEVILNIAASLNNRDEDMGIAEFKVFLKDFRKRRLVITENFKDTETYINKKIIEKNISPDIIKEIEEKLAEDRGRI